MTSHVARAGFVKQASVSAPVLVRPVAGAGLGVETACPVAAGDVLTRYDASVPAPSGGALSAERRLPFDAYRLNWPDAAAPGGERVLTGDPDKVGANACGHLINDSVQGVVPPLPQGVRQTLLSGARLPRKAVLLSNALSYFAAALPRLREEYERQSQPLHNIALVERRSAAGELDVWVKAARALPAGEPLCFSYGYAYWLHNTALDNVRSKQECYTLAQESEREVRARPSQRPQALALAAYKRRRAGAALDDAVLWHLSSMCAARTWWGAAQYGGGLDSFFSDPVLFIDPACGAHVLPHTAYQKRRALEKKIVRASGGSQRRYRELRKGTLPCGEAKQAVLQLAALMRRECGSHRARLDALAQDVRTAREPKSVHYAVAALLQAVDESMGAAVRKQDVRLSGAQASYYSTSLARAYCLQRLQSAGEIYAEAFSGGPVAQRFGLSEVASLRMKHLLSDEPEALFKQILLCDMAGARKGCFERGRAVSSDSEHDALWRQDMFKAWHVMVEPEVLEAYESGLLQPDRHTA